MFYYNQIVNYINSIFIGSWKDGELRHFERTVYWLKILKPDADEAMLIAAYGHDSERAFRAKDYDKIKKSQEGFRSKKHMLHHQETGAKIVSDFLEKNSAPQNIIAKVRRLISYHEEGGDEETDILKDADTISFFENNIPHFISVKVKEVGREKVKKKFKWMFDRITHVKAKEIAKPFFEKAIKELELK